jgi:pimeloyl-ACP methyl ester carboxylesterase
MTIGHTLLGRGAEKVPVMHGWFGDHTIFAPMFNALDLERFTCAFIDYRGYGKSRDRRGDGSMDEPAGDALALADTLG